MFKIYIFLTNLNELTKPMTDNTIIMYEYNHHNNDLIPLIILEFNFILQ